MVRKSYYIFVFICSLIKMDPVFSWDDVESSCIEDSGEEGPYIGSFATRQVSVPSPTLVKEENNEKPSALKKSPKKRAVSCFFLRKRKTLSDGK